MASPWDPEVTLLPPMRLAEKPRRFAFLEPLRPFLEPLRSPPRRNYYILLFLHSLLIVIHLILLAVIFAPPDGHLEHRFSVPLGRESNTLQSAIVVGSMAFNVVSTLSTHLGG
jgi:hypothetical protein